MKGSVFGMIQGLEYIGMRINTLSLISNLFRFHSLSLLVPDP